MGTVAWPVLGVLLIGTAALKAGDRHGTAIALTAYGISGRFAGVAWRGLVAVEAALGAGLCAGIEGAALAAAVLLTGFFVAQSAVLARGGAGVPCGCFGRGGRLSRASAARTALLAACCAAVPLT